MRCSSQFKLLFPINVEQHTTVPEFTFLLLRKNEESIILLRQVLDMNEYLVFLTNIIRI